MILEEGSKPFPLCPKFVMFVTWREFNGRHQYTAICARVGGGVGVEATAGGIGKEDHDIGLSGLRYTFGGGGRVQIPW